MNLLNTHGITITAWEESLKSAEIATRAIAAEKKKDLDDCRTKISSLEAQLSKSSLTKKKIQLHKELGEKIKLKLTLLMIIRQAKLIVLLAYF